MCTQRGRARGVTINVIQSHCGEHARAPPHTQSYRYGNFNNKYSEEKTAGNKMWFPTRERVPRSRRAETFRGETGAAGGQGSHIFLINTKLFGYSVRVYIAPTLCPRKKGYSDIYARITLETCTRVCTVYCCRGTRICSLMKFPNPHADVTTCCVRGAEFRSLSLRARKNVFNAFSFSFICTI